MLLRKALFVKTWLGLKKKKKKEIQVNLNNGCKKLWLDLSLKGHEINSFFCYNSVSSFFHFIKKNKGLNKIIITFFAKPLIKSGSFECRLTTSGL